MLRLFSSLIHSRAVSPGFPSKSGGWKIVECADVNKIVAKMSRSQLPLRANQIDRVKHVRTDANDSSTFQLALLSLFTSTMYCSQSPLHQCLRPQWGSRLGAPPVAVVDSGLVFRAHSYVVPPPRSNVMNSHNTRYMTMILIEWSRMLTIWCHSK